MKFFIPSVDEQDSVQTLREIRASFGDATGWSLSDRPFYRLEYQDSGGPRTATVGAELNGLRVRAIFEADHAIIVCTNCPNAKCKPIFVSKRDVLQIEEFDSEGEDQASRCPSRSASRMMAFLLTDIEGSTRLWEESPSRMRLALELHDSAIQEAVLKNGGRVFNTAGDAFFCSFDLVRGAASAAIAAQSMLRAVKWPENVLVKVRMCIHFGEATYSSTGDFVGAGPNHAANLLKLAMGGQIILSGEAVGVQEKFLPDGAHLCSQGYHRLGEISEPTPIYQLVHPSLGAVAPSPNRVVS